MKFTLSIIGALLINALLFLAIQKLVQPEHSILSLPNNVTMMDFVRLKKDNTEAQPKLKEQLPDKPKPPKKPPLPQKVTEPKPEKPEPPKVKPPTPEIKLPPQITDGPRLGEYLKKPKPKNKIKQKPAPIPEPVVEEEPQPVVQEPAETSDATSDIIDPSPVTPQEPEIETDVVPIYRLKPKYPPRAMRAGIEGVVTLEFTITEDGTVIDPVVVAANPPKLFDKAVLRAIKKWKFKPKIVNGKPVSRRARQDFNFNSR